MSDTAGVATHPYAALGPEIILEAVETYGVRCSGGLLALNSYENRVYRVDVEGHPAVAAKFYRPQRWSDAAILEEHAFACLLHAHEIPVVAPLSGPDGSTLNHHRGFRFAVYPWQPGRASELGRTEERQLLGRYLGRLHGIARTQPFAQRPTLSVQHYGHDALRYLQERGFIPEALRPAFESVARNVLAKIEYAFAHVHYQPLRLHGDCHLGNLLWTDAGVHLVDFDDCCTGPAVQDLWMLLSGSRAEMTQQLAELLEGYTQFAAFEAPELALIEPLRSLRLLHYSAWLARRWDDPAFPRAFPWFNSQRYWEQQILILREQEALLDEAPLTWAP